MEKLVAASCVEAGTAIAVTRTPTAGVPAEVLRVRTARIDLADLQGDILRAHGNSYDRTSYLFVAVSDERAPDAIDPDLTSEISIGFCFLQRASDL